MGDSSITVGSLTVRPEFIPTSCTGFLEHFIEKLLIFLRFLLIWHKAKNKMHYCPHTQEAKLGRQRRKKKYIYNQTTNVLALLYQKNIQDINNDINPWKGPTCLKVLMNSRDSVVNPNGCKMKAACHHLYQKISQRKIFNGTKFLCAFPLVEFAAY